MTLKNSRKYGDDLKVRRQLKMTELLRREVQEILGRLVKDPRLGKFTITELNVAPDLKTANVFVCRFLDENREPTVEEQDQLVEGLESASRFIYEQLKRRLVMKVIPSLRFEYDYRMSEISKIWDITRGTKEQRT